MTCVFVTCIASAVFVSASNSSALITAYFPRVKRYDKARLCRDVDFPYHPLKKGEEVQIIDFDKPENSALVTSHQYGQALDLPIDALEICEGSLKSR